MTNVKDYKDKIDPIINKLREERLDRKIKQKDLAGMLDLNTDSSLSAYENGQVVPRITFVRDWAYALDFELVLNKVEKPTRRRKAASASTDEIPEDLSPVYLSKYQTALAMGVLVGQVSQLREVSPTMAADLQMIADILARSIH